MSRPSSAPTDIKGATWLMTQLAAEDQPITAEEVARFAHNPSAAVSPLCIELKRVQGPVAQLMLGPNNTPAWVPNANMLIYGGNAHVRVLADTISGLTREAGSICSLKLLGFIESEPLFLIQTTLTRESYLVLNDRLIWRSSDRGDAVLCADGKILYWEIHGNLTHVSFGDKEGISLLNVVDRKITRLVRTSDGAIWAFWKDPNAPTTRLFGFLDNERILRARESTEIIDVVEGRAGIRFLGRSTGGIVNVHNLTLTFLHELARRGPAYHSGYGALPDGRSVYVGKLRHNQVAWVVNGEPQPALNTVTPIFQQGDCYCYWGAVGPHLLLMELPPKS